jgi:hypothetical protein
VAQFEPPLIGCSFQDAVDNFPSVKSTNIPEAVRYSNAMFFKVKGQDNFLIYQKGSLHIPKMPLTRGSRCKNIASHPLGILLFTANSQPELYFGLPVRQNFTYFFSASL